MFTPDDMSRYQDNKILCPCGHVSRAHYWYHKENNKCHDCECKQFDPDTTESTNNACGSCGDTSGNCFGDDMHEEDEIETNAKGGKQSRIDADYHAVPHSAIRAIAETMAKGRVVYGAENWRKIEASSHINHALRHIYLWLEGNVDEDHPGHAICRLAFAIEQAGNENW